MRSRILVCTGLLLGLAGALFAQQPVNLWVEGEAPTKQQIVPNAGLDEVNPDELSGGKWICSFAHENEPHGRVTYAVEIPVAGKYTVWVRAGLGTGLAYSWDDAVTPSEVDTKKGVDPIPGAATGVPFYPPVLKWYSIGPMDLTQGKHTLNWFLGGLKGKDRWCGMDCFLITNGVFSPNGKYQPGEKAPALIPAYGPGQAWDFMPAADTLDPAALWDLRSLNETVAGEHGFIRLSPDGNSFVRGDGESLRFWGVDLDPQPKIKLNELKRQSQFLAKRGVNIVRLFAKLEPKAAGSAVTDVDQQQIEGVWRQVAAMKAAGIYIVISPCWPGAITVQKSWGINPDGNQKCDSMFYLDPTLQAGYKAWLKALLTQPNPYTGMALANDPAVAIIQLQNEDSLLWWGGSNLTGPAMTRYRQLYADFLIKKYGSLDNTRVAWQNYEPEGHEMFIHPEWEKGLPPVLHAWDYTRDALEKKGKWPGFLQCSSDQVEFTTRLMYQYNSEMAQYLRAELGCKQLVNAGNWRTSDVTATQDAEYWSYTANDVIGRNYYTDSYHVGVQNGWRMNIGDYYTNVSMTKEPVKLPMNMKQPLGRPYCIFETSWVYPNLYQSEGPLMTAAQSSLSGLDICFWACSGQEPWENTAFYKWPWNTPVLLGQFPAAAYMYRQRLVATGAPAVVEHRSLQDIFTRKTSIITEESGWDPNRDTGNIPLTSKVKEIVDPLAYFVGPVQLAFDGDPTQNMVVDLAKYINREQKTVRSITGEIETNYGVGLYKVDAPQAKAISGFLADAGPQKLTDVEITCTTPYATIILVAMDGKPIKESAKIFVQVGTTNRPTGWLTRPTRARINGKQADALHVVNYGKLPWQVEKVTATITINNPLLTRATLLDVNGMPTKEAVEQKIENGAMTVTLPANTLYLMLTQ